MSSDEKTLQGLHAALNFQHLRQEIINSNIANADTPGYKSKVVEFEEALSQALNVNKDQNLLADSPDHYNVGSNLNSLSPEIYDDPNGIVSPDGNTVDRDKEMAKMAENKIMYDATVQLLNKKLGLIKYVLNQDR